MSASSNKSAFRAHFRAARLAVSVNDRALFAETAATYLRESDIFQQAKTIACYFSMPEEFDTAFIQQTIINAGKHCYMPVLTPEKTLLFSAYIPGDVLVPNRFNILEPIVTPVNIIQPNKLDLVLMPLVAFDNHGHRLGAGGGYYDRTFAFMHDHQEKPFLMGVGYALQAAQRLPTEPYDVHLHAVLTEKELLHFT